MKNKVKKLCYALLPLLLIVGGCNNEEIESRLTDIESRLSKLEDQVSELNSQVLLIQNLLNGKYFVQKVENLENNLGYNLYLVDKDGNMIVKTVLNGKDGKDGKDGQDGLDGKDGKDGKDGVDGKSPEIGVAKYTDGNYYWTLNGSWLIVDGKMVRANGLDGQDGKDGQDGQDGKDGQDGQDGKDGKDGADGLTPQFKIVDGKWYVKVGDGQWTYVGEATSSFVSPITSVDATSKEGIVILTLSGGTTIEVPLAGSTTVKLQIILADEDAFSSMEAGQTKSTEYQVTAPANITFTLDSYEPQGWKVVFSQPTSAKGTLSITIPAHETQGGKVMLVANGSDGSCYVRVVHVGVSESGEDPAQIDQTVDSGAGTLDLPSGVQDVVIPSEASSWVSLIDGKLYISANTDYSSRTVTVTYTVNGKTYTLVITQAQKDAIVLVADSIEAGSEAEEIAFVVRANVSVSASADADWIAVNPVTKELEDKPFTVYVQANDSQSSRTGTITFSHEDISQTVTLTQAAKAVTPEPASAYYLVTDMADLAAGDKIVIVNKAGDYALGTTQNINNRKAEAVTALDGIIEDLPQNVQLITLEGSTGSWNLSVGNGYLASANTNNRLVTASSVTSNATWTISMASDGEATIQASAGASTILRYNPNASTGNPIFCCYQESSSVKNPVFIYKEGVQPDPVYVTEYEEMGLYMGSSVRTYVPGTDQYMRLYEDNSLTFGLLNPSETEFLIISGISTEVKTGDSVQFEVSWKKDGDVVLSKQYNMPVLKEENGLLWIGNSFGKGIVIKK